MKTFLFLVITAVAGVFTWRWWKSRQAYNPNPASLQANKPVLPTKPSQRDMANKLIVDAIFTIPTLFKGKAPPARWDPEETAAIYAENERGGNAGSNDEESYVE